MATKREIVAQERDNIQEAIHLLEDAYKVLGDPSKGNAQAALGKLRRAAEVSDGVATTVATMLSTYGRWDRYGGRR